MASAPSDAELLAATIARAARPVFLTGPRLGTSERPESAGDRSDWAQRANLSAFLTEPGRFWEYFYPTARGVLARAPTAAHHALAALEEAGHVGGLIAQGADRLHQRAGSREVVEVYGNIITVRCERCGERYGIPEVGALIEGAPDGVPRCSGPGCGYPLRPEGTLWEEPLPAAAIERAWDLAAAADLFVILDSELRTAPISLLPSVPLTRGVPLYLVGEHATQYDRYAHGRIASPSGPVLEAIAATLGAPARRRSGP